MLIRFASQRVRIAMTASPRAAEDPVDEEEHHDREIAAKNDARVRTAGGDDFGKWHA